MSGYNYDYELGKFFFEGDPVSKTDVAAMLNAKTAEIERLNKIVADQIAADRLYGETHGKSVERAMSILGARAFDNIDHAAERAVRRIKELESQAKDAEKFTLIPALKRTRLFLDTLLEMTEDGKLTTRQ